MYQSSKKKINFFLYVTLIPFVLKAQLYNNQNFTELSSHFFGLAYYPSAWQSSIFEEDIYTNVSIKEKVAFNKLSNALRLNYSGAEKMLGQFKEDFFNVYNSKNIDFDIANFYFQNEKYRYALKWFNRISEKDVPKIELDLYYFNKGYTLFSAKNYKKARPLLEMVKNNKDYESDAHYYLGHISYQLDDYDGALKSFQSISEANKKDDLLYFQADMNFRLGRFSNAIELAKKALLNKNKAIKSELSKIIGESYFNLGNYEMSIPFLELYEGNNGSWKNTDYYQLGYAYFKQKKYDLAISQFNKIIGEKNEIAQNSYYALAECYLKKNKKQEALNAFKKAYDIDFNSSITEDALLNYAKLSYEIGNSFEEPLSVIIRFMEIYPKNDEINFLKELLIDSYSKAGNYSAALNILESKGAFKNNKILQKLLILNATEEYKNGSHKASNNLFKRALKLKENKLFEAYALYWTARSEYELNLFDQALDLYKQFKKHPKKSNVESIFRLNYDIGYVYFKLGEYEYSLKSFKAFNKENDYLDKSYQIDTYLRIGDSQFALKKYWPAMESYNTAIALNPKSAPYATYQKALSYGFVDRNIKKIETLNNFIKEYPNDPLVDDVFFELANTYSSEMDYDKALSIYDELISKFKVSPYLAKSNLNKGLILYNLEEYNSSKKVLEKVAVKYKKYSIGEQALSVLKEIAIDMGNVSDFSKWIKEKKLDKFTNVEIEKTLYNSAEKKFIEGNKNVALKLFEEYLDLYPEGPFSKEATYYLAEIYFEKQKWDKALLAYQSLITGEISVYSEKALTRIIILLKNKNQQIEAIKYMEKLLEIASFEENKRFAKFNLMRTYFESQEIEKAIMFSDDILKLKDLDERVYWDAHSIRARSFIMLKDSIKAAQSYKLLEKAPVGEIVAEATYFRAFLLNKEKKYIESNKLINKIARSSSQESNWNVKALLLLAKNYYALADPFQAIFVLESLIENFTMHPEIVKEAKELKEGYDMSLKNENSSTVNKENQ